MTRNRKRESSKKVPAETSAPHPAAQIPATDGDVKPVLVTEAAVPSFPLEAEAQERAIRCVICGSSTQAGSPEHMCWVCRRLKISAWREVEQQMPAQE